jgi:hypothetical protein
MAGYLSMSGKPGRLLITKNSCQADYAIFTMAEQVDGGIPYLWFGTLNGVSRLNEANGDWQTFTPDNSGYNGDEATAKVLDKDKGLDLDCDQRFRDLPTAPLGLATIVNDKMIGLQNST